LSGVPAATEHEALQWIAFDDLIALDWAEADIPIVQMVLQRFS